MSLALRKFKLLVEKIATFRVSNFCWAFQMNTWKCVGIGPEGERLLLNGLNPWEHEWRQTSDAPVVLSHPSYSGQLHRMNVYEIQAGGRSLAFAAGELSPSVWGFYVPG